MSNSATYVSILTPPGRGAVATVAVRGPEALAMVQRHFSTASGRGLGDVAFSRIQFGRFHGLHGSAEEIVAVASSGDEVELHCHGGPAAAEALVSTLIAAGATRNTWQQFTEIDESDPLRAECRVALADAKTARTCAILLDQYRGALGRELSLIESLEAQATAEAQRDAHARLTRLLDLWSTVGQHLTRPWRIVISGPPNVGKSSLVNALLGYQRSIVFDQPGTTRDVLAAITAIDGWPVELIDTAGLRAAADSLEAAGVERAQRQFADADYALLVSDASQANDSDVTESLAQPAPGRQVILVGNKADLIGNEARRDWQRRFEQGILVSAKTGEGLDELAAAISRRLVPAQPEAGQAAPFTTRQVALVQQRLRRCGLSDQLCRRNDPFHDGNG